MNGLREIMEKIRSLSTEADQMVQDTLFDSVNANIAAVAKSLAPKKTGFLQSSILVKRGDTPTSVLVVAEAPYAKFLEFGTRPHTIEAKNARALHFTMGGREVFAKSVLNPGIEEGKYSFLGPAVQMGWEKVQDDLIALFRQQLSS
ncbi:MAG TPA: HK97-gp10 family putative phage morphogenesis protein [Nitrososphaerales archaeon]|nr:HK97-gp10 family putative phage morphogenesis protein [Nitrososphaerales archaeon]